jgi:DNA-binding CsgD family transcriptional regulator
MPRLLPMLRELVPAESAGFFWVDSTGAMQNLYAERMLSQQKMQLYFDHFYEGGAFDFKRQFLARAKETEAVSSLPVDESFKRSAYYNEILRELDAHHVMHGIVREHGAALGQLSLYRPPSSASFTQAERNELDSVLHYIAHAIAAAPLSTLSTDVATSHADARRDMLVNNSVAMIDTDDDAMALIDREGRLLHASDAAKRLLVQATDGQFSPSSLAAISGPSSPVAELLKVIARKLYSDNEALPSMVQDGRWGRIVLRAYRMDDGAATFANAEAPIAVRISRQEPMLLKFAHAMQSLNLSPQMQEIALHLARGKSNSEIADAMTLTSHTVNYHIKTLFQKLGTHGREETVKRIMS